MQAFRITLLEILCINMLTAREQFTSEKLAMHYENHHWHTFSEYMLLLVHY